MLIFRLVRRMIYHLPREMAHGFWYFVQTRKKLSLPPKRPNYDQYIHYMSCYVYDKSYGKFADKYEVRDYIKSCGLEELLIPLIGVYDSVDEIDIDKLPEQFVLKVTHGSGDLFCSICTQKSTYNAKKEFAKLRKAMKIPYAHANAEYQYESIKPKIVCEELLGNGKIRLTDYKVECFFGKPQCIFVCSERNKGRDYYSPTWEYLDFIAEKYRYGKEIEKPKNLEEMMRAAEIISRPFPLARIDFYNIDGKIYFGEVTLTPSAGYVYQASPKGIEAIGELFVEEMNKSGYTLEDLKEWKLET